MTELSIYKKILFLQTWQAITVQISLGEKNKNIILHWNY